MGQVAIKLLLLNTKWIQLISDNPQNKKTPKVTFNLGLTAEIIIFYSELKKNY